MKKFTVLFLSLSMIFSLVACGSQNSENSAQTGQTANESTTSEDTQESDLQTEETQTESSVESVASEQETQEKKTLVVYYSASGNTEAAANYIAAATDADVFELVPAVPYTDDDLDWTDDESRVVYEYENPEERAVELVESTVPDWESYDVVFIGYPIWWGIAAWPVNEFIEGNDFTGKTVVPFCTSASSGLGESGELLAEAAGTGEWLEGERFTSRVSEETVQEWIESLGL